MFSYYQHLIFFPFPFPNSGTKLCNSADNEMITINKNKHRILNESKSQLRQEFSNSIIASILSHFISNSLIKLEMIILVIKYFDYKSRGLQRCENENKKPTKNGLNYMALQIIYIHSMIDFSLYLSSYTIIITFYSKYTQFILSSINKQTN